MTTRRSPDDAPRSVFPGFGDLSDDLAGVVGHLAGTRRAAGLTQDEIAARMGTSQSAVARLEAGRGDVRVSTLQRYAHALGRSVRFAVAPEGDPGGARASRDDAAAGERS